VIAIETILHGQEKRQGAATVSNGKRDSRVETFTGVQAKRQTSRLPNSSR
jgi:hypothetical protein